MEMRCEHKLHGVVHDGVVEVKCNSHLCGHRPGVVVIHRFDPLTGELIETKRYKDTPVINNKKGNDNAVGNRAAVRAG